MNIKIETLKLEMYKSISVALETTEHAENLLVHIETNEGKADSLKK